MRSEAVPVAVNPAVPTQAISSIPAPEEAKLQKKLEGLNLSQRPPVILPNHIHVPESERINFSFGSFDASFGTIRTSKGVPESDDKSTVLSETSHGAEGAVEQSIRSERNQS